MQRPGAGNEPGMLEAREQAGVQSGGAGRRVVGGQGKPTSGPSKGKETPGESWWAQRVPQGGEASWGTGWGAKGGAKSIGFGSPFLLVSLLVGGEAKEDDVDLHGARPDCSGKQLWAVSSG